MTRLIYRVKEVFSTRQGEGLNLGVEAVFARFAGCNLWSGHADSRDKGAGSCAAFCDTDFAVGEGMSLRTLLARVAAVRGNATLCVLTGGEPALQLDSALRRALHDAGLSVALETNGTVANDTLLTLDHLCVSPKLRRDGSGASTALVDRLAFDPGAFRGTRELKVVYPGGDGSEAAEEWSVEALKAYAARAPGWSACYLMPRDDAALPGDEHPGENVARCVHMLGSLPGWRLGVQAHKAWVLP